MSDEDEDWNDATWAQAENEELERRAKEIALENQALAYGPNDRAEKFRRAVLESLQKVGRVR